MLYSKSSVFNRLLDQIQTLPIINCHEHRMGPDSRLAYKEPIAALIQGYVMSDLEAASFGIPPRELQKLSDPNVTTDEKWPTFDKLWRSTEHTAYARVSKMVLQTKLHPVISLPGFHGVKFFRESIEYCGKLTNQYNSSLDEYLEAVFIIFQRPMIWCQNPKPRSNSI